MVRKHDHIKSSDIAYWLNYVDHKGRWFDNIADSFRDHASGRCPKDE